MEILGEQDLLIENTTKEDIETILWLFEQASGLQGKNGYKVWSSIDRETIRKDIESRQQYKIQRANDIICIFTALFNDPHIWGERDRRDAVYLHRIVVHPRFKGQRQFETVLNWAVAVARSMALPFVRMDTWADNHRLIAYYRSFGFEAVETYTTADSEELPPQNRNLKVVLLQKDISVP